jgi:two-component system sensor histidine kinase/response regulator
LKISIPPPFWQTLWFRLLVILGSLGAISGVFVLRIRAIEAQRQELELKVDERTLQLRQAMIEAEAANRAKSTFLANMSHEFRTPLNAILGFTQIMTRDERLGPDQQENIAIIHRSSEHLLGLINDVLEMSKIEAGRAVLNKTNFDLSRMLEGLEEMFSVRAGSKGVALRLELAAQTPQYVHADEGKLRQVLMNLLGNAVKFTKAGLITLRAFPVQEGREAPPGEQFICFEVEDTGPGIAPEEIEQLFLPFVQSSAGLESQEGTGLGLTISQQFVRLMGAPPAVVSEPAGIRVRSQVGQGSIFSFTVPVGLVPEDDIQEPGPARKIIGLEPGQPVYRLLAVDDQEVNRKLLVRILAPLGFELREAANGQEAIETWETWEPHLIWMDMRMPVMDGYQATRYIKSTIRGQATIIVAITASSLEEDRHVILAEGCDDYMRKPFLEATLFKMLEQHLGVRFIYQPLEPSPQTGQPPGAAGPPEAPSSRQRRLAIHLSQADPQWLNQLERATILADQDELLNLAAQIAGSDPALSRDITTLVNKFDHDRILFLIQQARELANHEPK